VHDAPRSFEAAYNQVFLEMQKIMFTKRQMRGAGNIQEQGLEGILNRLGKDKLARVNREVEAIALRAKAAAHGFPQEVIDQFCPDPRLLAPAGEGMQDDLMDIANYAIIAVMVERGWWGLPSYQGGAA
jgi:hypothetical protein